MHYDGMVVKVEESMVHLGGPLYAVGTHNSWEGKLRFNGLTAVFALQGLVKRRIATLQN